MRNHLQRFRDYLRTDRCPGAIAPQIVNPVCELQKSVLEDAEAFWASRPPPLPSGPEHPCTALKRLAFLRHPRQERDKKAKRLKRKEGEERKEKGRGRRESAKREQLFFHLEQDDGEKEPRKEVSDSSLRENGAGPVSSAQIEAEASSQKIFEEDKPKRRKVQEAAEMIPAPWKAGPTFPRRTRK